jgi:hypothetical protein
LITVIKLPAGEDVQIDSLAAGVPGRLVGDFFTLP